MDTSAFIYHLRGHSTYKGQIVHHESIPHRDAQFGELKNKLPSALQSALEALHQFPLYSHQTQAIDCLFSGKNVIISTPAASGKTLCYNLAVACNFLENKNSRALYLFPTKALAQDQLRNLNELTSAVRMKVKASTFDGDTPWQERAEIRRSAKIIFSNPDMLQLSILPNHRSWISFLGQLKYVVIDEAHAYRGVFGSHVANVIRRLRRICARYGSNPQFICSSATIANPAEHASSLTGLPFDAVVEDGAAFGGKEFIFWNPPLIDEAKSARRSASYETTFLLTELVSMGIRSLAFARTRKLVELIYTYVRDQLATRDPLLTELIKPYRAGYLAEDRRNIERELFSGRLLAAVATNALEMGVDIGTLDATILTGYPGSIASTWQQAGRSGRRGERSLSILVGSQNPLDQYFMHHPEALFEKGFEYALVAPTNPHILKPHLLCAAWEFPLTESDSKYFGDIEEMRNELEKERSLNKRGRSWYPSPQIAYPAEKVNFRSSSSASYSLIDDSSGKLLETIESETAFFRVHAGAIHLHQGQVFLVNKLDLDTGTAYAVPSNADYYTQTKDLTDITIIEILSKKDIKDGAACLGRVKVDTTVLGFKKKRVYTEEIIGEELLNLPTVSFETVGFWIDISSRIEMRLKMEGCDFPGGLHAAEHASIGMLPLFALCDRNDIGGVSTAFHPDTGKAQIFIYDAHPGGVGIAEKGFELMPDLWGKTLKLILECPCEGGCPSCVQSPKCGNNNQPLDKMGAQIILEMLVEDMQEVMAG